MIEQPNYQEQPQVGEGSSASFRTHKTISALAKSCAPVSFPDFADFTAFCL